MTPGDAAWFYYWHGAEYLQLNDVRDSALLAGFDDAQPGIIFGRIQPATAPFLFGIDCHNMTAGADDHGGVAQTPRLLLTGLRPARGRVGLRVELPDRTKVHLAIFDVMGRQVQTLADGQLGPGAVDLPWDGHDALGAAVGSGVCFASMTTAAGRRSVRIPLLR